MNKIVEMPYIYVSNRLRILLTENFALSLKKQNKTKQKTFEA